MVKAPVTRHLLSTVTMACLLAVSIFPVAVAQEPAPAGATIGINLNIDVNALINSIASAVSAAQDRGAFVMSVLDTVTSNTRGQYNIVVVNMEQGSEFNPNWDTTWFTSVNYQGITFGIYVFSGGELFVHHGDGGWINWGMYGVYTRSGDGGSIVQFSQR